ncbi:MAG: Na(+)-translocating NADH-quinone reductase subunit A [Planctomycetaceae bacterium]
MHRITKGLDIPITGEPVQAVVESPRVSRVALVASDYVGMKPTMLVGPGDVVKQGQPVFTDKKTAGVTFTAPAAGRVLEVNRGARRAFQSLVIEVEGDDAIRFDALASGNFDAVTREAMTTLLAESGMWTAFRTRPYSKVPAVGTVPHSIFVQAMDTNPLAADVAPLIRERERDFRFGLAALTKLTDGHVYLCRRPAQMLPGEDHAQVSVEEFEGPHPAGLPGTHIHLLAPVGLKRTVWTINYQDVMAIGHLVTTGLLDTSRVISVAGPAVNSPQLFRTQIGACISQLTQGLLAEGNVRVVSGSLLNGRRVAGPEGDYLGRYHLQVSAVLEGNEREFLGWVSPGSNRFSVRNVFSSALNSAKRFALTTSTGGSKRAMVPIGMYEQVMPLDILPTFLLRSLIVGDTEQAQALGCLELDEEDLALCTFVCPGKYEYGPILRERLNQIEKEG